MASWQAHFMSFVLRHTFKPRLARCKDAVQARKVMGGGAVFKRPAGIHITPATVGGVPGEWVKAESGTSRGLLLYLHGGGYFACSAASHRAYTTYFAQEGFHVYAPDYRLAPEDPFPAAVHDAVAVYRALRADASASTAMVIGGDSAGGGLTLAAMLKLRAEGGPLPLAALLFSPLTDLVGTGNSRMTNDKRCAMFFGEGLAFAREMYLGSSGDPHDPLASPLYADLKGLPPLLIHAGSDETLLDDSIQFAERARSAGVSVELRLWPAVPHVWQLFHRFIPEGRQSLAAASQFLSKAIAAANIQTANVEMAAR